MLGSKASAALALLLVSAPAAFAAPSKLLVLEKRNNVLDPNAVVAPGSSGYLYKGCYPDSTSARILDPEVTGQGYDTMTAELCLSLCSVNHFAYAGLEYGGQCYCGNSIPDGIQPAAEADCNMGCNGNSLEICGGPDRVTLYEVNPPDNRVWEKVGCYTDNISARTLASLSDLPTDSMTVEVCTAACQKVGGYVIAGLENGNECWCGNQVMNGAVPAPGSCTSPCAGNSAETCGAPNYLDVYKFSDPSINPADCINSQTVTSTATVTPTTVTTTVSTSVSTTTSVTVVSNILKTVTLTTSTETCYSKTSVYATTKTVKITATTTSTATAGATIGCSVKGWGNPKWSLPVSFPIKNPSAKQCADYCNSRNDCGCFFRAITSSWWSSSSSCTFYSKSLPDVLVSQGSGSSFGYDPDCPSNQYDKRDEVPVQEIEARNYPGPQSCAAVSAFTDVCACLGVPQTLVSTTITLPTPTSSVTVTTTTTVPATTTTTYTTKYTSTSTTVLSTTVPKTITVPGCTTITSTVSTTTVTTTSYSSTKCVTYTPPPCPRGRQWG